jgi:hypothetical protein
VSEAQWVKNALALMGLLGLFWGIAQYFLNRGRRQANALISKTEREAGKTVVEKYLVELNVNELIQKKADLIDEKYKDIIFSMQKEHFEIKKDIQGRLEKEMKARIEAEQENEILKNELHLIKQKSSDQDYKIEELTKKVSHLENGK